MTRFGLDYFGRRSVDADETTEDLISGEVLRQQTLDSGTEDEAAAYGALEWNWGSTVVLAGGRFTWDRQTNADQPSVTNTAGSGFVGAVVPLGNGFEFVSNAGTGLRFPSLSERFFSGVTGRGEVVGNPNLDPERSGYIFHNDISDYIERVEVEPDLLTFVNLTSGTIQGVELEGFYQFNGAWSFSFGGHLIDGENDMNEPLADIPANRAYLGGKWSAGKWMWEGRWEQRAERSDFGSGEKPIPAASLLSMSLAYQVREDLAITLTGRSTSTPPTARSPSPPAAPSASHYAGREGRSRRAP
jgi:iron complex outermembrane receptor protein